MFSSSLFLICFYYNGKNQLFSSLVFSVPCFQSSCFSLRLCFGRKLSVCAFQLGFCFFLLFSVPLYALCCSLLSPYVADPPWFFFCLLVATSCPGFFLGSRFMLGFPFCFPVFFPLVRGLLSRFRFVWCSLFWVYFSVFLSCDLLCFWVLFFFARLSCNPRTRS